MSDPLDFLYTTVENAQSTQGGNNIRDGKGRLIVDKIVMEKKTNGYFGIAEFVVESSEKVPVQDLKTNQVLDIAPNGPGTKCSIAVPLDSPKIKSGPGNWKAFILSLLGYTDAQVAANPGSLKAAMAALRSDAQPARGMLIDFNTYRKMTKDGQTQLTLPKWTHVPPTAGNDKASITARRAKLEGAAQAAAGAQTPA